MSALAAKPEGPQPGLVFAEHGECVYAITSVTDNSGRLKIRSVGFDGHLRIWEGERRDHAIRIGSRPYGVKV
jgi:hypothetical protein